MERNCLPPDLRDERLPAFSAMIKEDPSELLDAALTPKGARVLDAHARQVSWRPGRSVSVTYDATVSWSGRDAKTEQIIAATARDVTALPAGATIIERGDAHAAVWRLADDPALPGLAVALDPERARGMLDSLGVPPGPVRARLRAYRPARRAVVELDVNGYRIFVKVVPPAEVADLQERHRIMAEQLPVPMSHGWSDEYGVVVLRRMPGATLRECLRDPAALLPDPADLEAMLDRIPALGDGKQAVSPADAVVEHTRLLRRLVPDKSATLRTLSACLRQERAPASLAPVHGDFYEAQLLVSDGRISAMLDLDTAALGHRIDDWATMIGHLAVLAHSSPPPMCARVRAYMRRLLTHADSACDSAGLRRAVSAVILGLATGPFRVQSPAWQIETRRRIGLAQMWCANAAQVDLDMQVHEKRLTRVS